MAQKLWRASQILGISPFDPAILHHNEAQLDFILEMYAQENPSKLKFSRAGKEDPGVEKVRAEAAWADVLTGKSLTAYMTPRMPNAATLETLRRMMAPRNVVVPMGKRNDK